MFGRGAMHSCEQRFGGLKYRRIKCTFFEMRDMEFKLENHNFIVTGSRFVSALTVMILILRLEQVDCQTELMCLCGLQG